MRRKDDRVLALDRVDGHVDHRDERIGDRQQTRDHADRLRVLDDALFGELFDDADALGAERIPQDAENLPATGRHAFRAAHPAFLDAHTRQPAEGLFVGRGPRDRLAQPIDRRLVVVTNGLHGGTSALQKCLRLDLFLVGDCSGHKGIISAATRRLPRSTDGVTVTRDCLRLSVTASACLHYHPPTGDDSARVETKSAGLAIAALRARQSGAVRPEGTYPWRRLHSARSRGQRACLREGRGPVARAGCGETRASGRGRCGRAR